MPLLSSTFTDPANLGTDILGNRQTVTETANITFSGTVATTGVVTASTTIQAVASSHLVLNTQTDSTQVRINSRSFTQASGDTIGMQAKPNQTVTTTGEVYGAQFSPRVASAVGAGSLIGASFDPILKGATTGTVTNLRGVQVTLTDDNSAGRTITNAVMIRLWHQLAAHTFTNGVIGISFEAAGGRAWTYAMAFADDGGTGLADLASAIGSVNGAVKVKIGSTTCYIPTYDGYTPA